MQPSRILRLVLLGVCLKQLGGAPVDDKAERFALVRMNIEGFCGFFCTLNLETQPQLAQLNRMNLRALSHRFKGSN